MTNALPRGPTAPAWLGQARCTKPLTTSAQAYLEHQLWGKLVVAGVFTKLATAGAGGREALCNAVVDVENERAAAKDPTPTERRRCQGTELYVRALTRLSSFAGVSGYQLSLCRRTPQQPLHHRHNCRHLPYLTFCTFCTWAFCVKTKVPTTWGTHQDIIETLI